MAKKQAKKKAKTIKKTPKAKTTKAKTRRPTKKVYHIFHFTERFEIKNKYGHYHEWPLEYRRDYVAPKTDEGVHYEKQLSLCDESPNMDALHTAYSKLVRIAAKKSKNYRGYILDGYEPASRKLIAKWLKKEVIECKKILDELERIGLIEYVSVPDKYGPVDDNLVPGEAPNDDSNKSQKKKKSTSNKRSREKSGKIGKVRDSFKKTATVNGNRNRNNNKKRNNKPVPEKADAKTNQNPTERQLQERKNRMLEQLRAGSKRKANRPSPDRHPAEADMPTESDAGEAKRDNTRGNLPSSIIDSEIDMYLDDLLVGRHGQYSDEAKRFGTEIFIRLRVPHKPTSPQGLRELCSFASMWDTARMAGLSSGAMNEIWAASMRDAEKIGKKRGRIKPKKSIEAIFGHSFGRRLDARKRKEAG